MRVWLIAVAAALIAAASGAAEAGTHTRASSYMGFGGGVEPPPGWRPYSPSSPFNVPISADDRVHPRSSAMVSRIVPAAGPSDIVVGYAGTRDDYDHPLYFARSSDPVYRLRATRPWGPNPLTGRRVHVPAEARAAGGTDAHLTVVEPDGNEIDLWGVQSKPAHGGTLRFAWGGELPIDGSGVGSAATATRVGSAAGVIRAAELRAGRIDHALALVVRCTSRSTNFGFGVHPRPPGDAGGAYVWPALKGASPCVGPAKDIPPAGARVRLDLDRSQLAKFDGEPAKKAILIALVRYGAYIVDTGGPGFGFLAESSSSFTSFGEADPMLALARNEHFESDGEGHYTLDVASGVDWRRSLQVITPPRRGGGS